ncbi:alpha/beta fold hydrolase [Variovorax sp. PBS-H4]|uniref:alpha/beta fold hydrolase n=1 Tax=Variovorax sp. PBS-H4 TaxID=434008 RepID=UPI0013A53198|nr:alpha/beta hydrolase [Variovorax sp. PBS-H4]
MASTLRGGHVHANGIRQHYLHYGPGDSAAGRPPLVLIPGITSPAITWGFVGERFGRAADTYILDVRGRGLSAAGPGLDYSVQAQAADLLAFVEALALEEVDFVGHSMGARIAGHAAACRPRALRRLVLADPPVCGPGRRPYPAHLDWYLKSIALAARGCDAEAMREYCPTWSDEQRALRAEWLHTCDPRAVAVSFQDFHEVDFHAELPAIAVPTLLLTAERGDVVPDADVAEIRQLNPLVAHRRVPGAGHMIPWDNPEGFDAAVSKFLGFSF